MTAAATAGEVPAKDALTNCPRAYGEPLVRGRIRVSADDFQVCEKLGFGPEGVGEHLFLHVEKTGQNTAWVARELARVSGVHAREVGYAGIKDRHARVRQYFTIRVGNKPEPDWSGLGEGIRVLESGRHRRKLQRGALKSNEFKLVIRHLSGQIDSLEPRLAHVATEGVPNYFGPQRFGRNQSNLTRARAACRNGRWPRDRFQRGLLFSAARAHLFNNVLAERVVHGEWNRLIAGDIALLDGTNSLFDVVEPDSTLAERLMKLDLHPTGPMYGIGGKQPSADAAALEHKVVARDPVLAEGLERVGIKAARRALRVVARAFGGVVDGDTLRLTFVLPPGAYATAVLHELLSFEETDHA